MLFLSFVKEEETGVPRTKRSRSDSVVENWRISFTSRVSREA
jgi:hypothetical protein